MSCQWITSKAKSIIWNLSPKNISGLLAEVSQQNPMKKGTGYTTYYPAVTAKKHSRYYSTDWSVTEKHICPPSMLRKLDKAEHSGLWFDNCSQQSSFQLPLVLQQGHLPEHGTHIQKHYLCCHEDFLPLLVFPAFAPISMPVTLQGNEQTRNSQVTTHSQFSSHSPYFIYMVHSKSEIQLSKLSV